MTNFHAPYTFMKQSEMRRTAEPYREEEKSTGGVMWVDWEWVNKMVARREKKEKK